MCAQLDLEILKVIEIGRTRNICSLSVFPRLCHRTPSSSFGTMEALSVDMGRLKSGEVNLGVSFLDTVTSEDGRLIEVGALSRHRLWPSSSRTGSSSALTVGRPPVLISYVFFRQIPSPSAKGRIF